MNKHNSNNFDFLRLLFSSAVIVSHSFPLTGQPEWFAEHTNGQLGLGGFSVECFFIMSGYLIFISLKNSSSVLSYLWKRVLRIFPALFGLLLVTGVALTAVSGNAQFMITKQFLQYSVDVLSLYKVNYSIGDIFANNPYPRAINGSLWSLAYEFSMYLLVAAIFWFRKSNIALYVMGGLFILSSVFYLSESTFLKDFFMKVFKLDTAQLYKLTAFFVAGSLLSYVDLRKHNHFWWRCVLLGLLVLSLFLNVFKEACLIILPVFILLVANASTPYLRSVATKTGDLSYGIYIYGFLVQQLLMHYFNLSPWELTLIALPVSAILAYASWHIIEKKMMSYKNLI